METNTKLSSPIKSQISVARGRIPKDFFNWLFYYEKNIFIRPPKKLILKPINQRNCPNPIFKENWKQTTPTPRRISIILLSNIRDSISFWVFQIIQIRLKAHWRCPRDLWKRNHEYWCTNVRELRNNFK
jgi:hypothetical protein